jgi:hypothetical protein
MPSHYPHHPPPLRTEKSQGELASAIRRCEIYSRVLLAGEGGEGGVICETVAFVNGSSDQLQNKTKIANTILLLCYLNKICLSLTGGLWQASAHL